MGQGSVAWAWPSIPVVTPTLASDCVEHAADAQRHVQAETPERIAHLIQVLLIRRKFNVVGKTVIDLWVNRERHAGKTLEYIFQQPGIGIDPNQDQFSFATRKMRCEGKLSAERS